MKFLFALLWSLLALSAQAETIRMAVTTSFHNSGLADVLLPALESDTGVEVQLLVVGTGQALRLGQAGDVDALLVHSRAAEEAFVAQGFGTHRREIMFNDFVFVGPRDDPADLSSVMSARAAMRRLRDRQADFVSRGDDSGTHARERGLWESAGIDPLSLGPWYRSVGAGMGASLNTASAMNAYILSDRASWLKFQNKGDLDILFEGDPVLFNQYAFLPVSPARHPHVRSNLTRVVEDWLTGTVAAGLIDGYQIDGQDLFQFNAEPKDD